MDIQNLVFSIAPSLKIGATYFLFRVFFFGGVAMRLFLYLIWICLVKIVTIFSSQVFLISLIQKPQLSHLTNSCYVYVPHINIFDPEIAPIITARKRSLQRLCFYTCLSVHTGGVPGQVTPPGRYTPWPGTTQAGTPPGQVHLPPQCMLGYSQ